MKTAFNISSNNLKKNQKQNHKQNTTAPLSNITGFHTLTCLNHAYSQDYLLMCHNT